MTTRVTEGARRERPSFLASSPLNARAHALPLLNLKNLREAAHSLVRLQLVEKLATPLSFVNGRIDFSPRAKRPQFVLPPGIFYHF